MAAGTTTRATAPSNPTLARLLREGASAKAIERHLDALSSADRLGELLGVGGKAIGRLYDAVADAPALTLEEIVPAGAAEGETIVFQGKNSLPLFSRFQKRFARVGGALLGYNDQAMSFVTGPGYFVVRDARGDGPHPKEPYFDYTTPPPSAPPGWPPYKPNDSGLSRAVYKGMHDFMRRVCSSAMVGKAYKRGVAEGAYFWLARG